MKKRIAALIPLILVTLLSFSMVTGAYYSKTITFTGRGSLVIPEPKATEKPTFGYPGADSLIERVRRGRDGIIKMHDLIEARHDNRKYETPSRELENEINTLVRELSDKLTGKQSQYGTIAGNLTNQISNDYSASQTHDANSVINYKNWITNIGYQATAKPDAYNRVAEDQYAFLITFDNTKTYQSWDLDPYKVAYNLLVDFADTMDARLAEADAIYKTTMETLDRIDASYKELVRMRDELLTLKQKPEPMAMAMIVAMPTAEPTAEPTTEPTAEPTAKPTAEPTAEPTAKPTAEPTAEPTTKPTAEPTAEPTAKPTAEPTAEPTAKPTPEITPWPVAQVQAVQEEEKAE